MRKYFPYLLCIAFFLLGQFLGTQDKSGEELLKRKFEQEQQWDRDSISALLNKITALSAESATIRERMVQDSLKYSDALERNQRAYLALKRKYDEINLSRATVHDLDSIVSVLFPN